MYRKLPIVLFVCLVLSFSTASQAIACTLWAATGDSVEDGGTLLVKNRDWAPNHRQELKYVKPKAGYSYIGLFAADGEYSGLKAGVNEKGLVVVSASASSISMRERKQMPGTHALLRKLLSNCGSVDDALKQSALFVGPRFLMLADKHKVASVEVGPAGSFAVQVKENGIIYHTNHYIDDQMAQYNRKIGESSKIRYRRIGELLERAASPFNLNTFVSFSHDRIDGDNNSIFRLGSTPQKARTLAVWAVSLTPSRAPELYVEMYNPGETGKTYHFIPFPPTDSLNKGLEIPVEIGG